MIHRKVTKNIIEAFKDESDSLDEKTSVLEQYAKYLKCNIEDITIASSEEDYNEGEKKEFKELLETLENNTSISSPFDTQGYTENYVYLIDGRTFILIYDHGFVGVYSKA